MIDTERGQQTPRAPRGVRRREPGAVRWSGIAGWAALVVAVLLAITCAHARPGEEVVHHEQTEHYGIWVVERGGLRYLRFERDGVDQSAVKPGDPGWLEFTYTRATMAAFGVVPEARRVLVVGLGGGTIPMFLRQAEPEMEIDVVEIDPAVVRVAREHLEFAPDARVRVHVADGRRFIEESEARWDVIVLDAYGADAIPRHLATREFLEAVKARLAPGGVAVANLWGERVNPLYPSMMRTYEAVFPEVHAVRALYGSSRIVVAPREATGWTHARFLAGVEALTTRWRLRYDLREVVKRGYLAPGQHIAGGGVLEDR